MFSRISFLKPVSSAVTRYDPTTRFGTEYAPSLPDTVSRKIRCFVDDDHRYSGERSALPVDCPTLNRSRLLLRTCIADE